MSELSADKPSVNYIRTALVRLLSADPTIKECVQHAHVLDVPEFLISVRSDGQVGVIYPPPDKEQPQGVPAEPQKQELPPIPGSNVSL